MGSGSAAASGRVEDKETYTMTDKEFKRLTRAQLIDIIYQLQLKQEELTAENERLNKELTDKRLRVSQAGNLAQAALEVHNVMRAAQDAADHYVEEIRFRADQDKQRMLKEAEAEAARIIGNARQKAAQGAAPLKREAQDIDPVEHSILSKHR